jgi:hypothetical protein
MKRMTQRSTAEVSISHSAGGVVSISLLGLILVVLCDGCGPPF